jgi:hypothetical protein
MVLGSAREAGVPGGTDSAGGRLVHATNAHAAGAIADSGVLWYWYRCYYCTTTQLVLVLLQLPVVVKVLVVVRY